MKDYKINFNQEVRRWLNGSCFLSSQVPYGAWATGSGLLAEQSKKPQCHAWLLGEQMNIIIQIILALAALVFMFERLTAMYNTRKTEEFLRKEFAQWPHGCRSSSLLRPWHLSCKRYSTWSQYQAWPGQFERTGKPWYPSRRINSATWTRTIECTIKYTLFLK